jgi:hypothetical protein
MASAVLVLGVMLSAHKQKHHRDNGESGDLIESPTHPSAPASEQVTVTDAPSGQTAIKVEQPVDLDAVKRQYESQVKPILERKCFDCHGNQTKFPWYYKIPGIKQLIEHDIKEAHEHCDMSDGFPFTMHGKLSRDLDGFLEEIEEGTMPPFRYRLVHRGANISKPEREIIEQWARAARHLTK